MAIKNYKPTTPSRRNMSVTDYSELSKNGPEKSLLRSLNKKAGRNRGKKKKERGFPASLQGTPSLKKAATYSPALRCSTIGAPGLNFSVRDGKRWNTGAKAT